MTQYNITPIQKKIIESLVNEHYWLINCFPDDDERFSEIYIEADKMADELEIDRKEFWFKYFERY